MDALSAKQTRIRTIPKSFLAVFIHASGMSSGVNAAPEKIESKFPALQTPVDFDIVETALDNCSLIFKPDRHDPFVDGIGDADV